MSVKVAMVRVGASVAEAVREAMELAEWRRYITPGADVSLKVNLGWNIALPGSVTSPWVVEGVILAIRDHVRSICIIESDQVLVQSRDALRASFIDEVCRRYGIPYVNMSEGRYERLPLEDGLVLKHVDMPEILLKTEMITIPVMKTHDKSVITGSIKNQWGCLRESRHNLHPVLDRALVDISRVYRPRFSVLDATVCMEGNAPKSGAPRIVDRVLASSDFVALEAVQARIMGFDPAAIRHIQLCAKNGLGMADPDAIEVVGEDHRDLNLGFKPAQHNLVSLAELVLRGSFLRPLFFETPLFGVCCALARAWYWLWLNLGPGRRLRQSILSDSKYGPQWRRESWI